MREQGYVSNDFATVGTGSDIKRHLHLDEIAELLQCREDLELTEEKVNKFIADLN